MDLVPLRRHGAWPAIGSTTQPTHFDKLGDRNGVGWAFGLLAFVEFFERHFAEAEALAELVMREADQRGDEWAVGNDADAARRPAAVAGRSG